MPVVINEFEVVPEPASRPSPAEAPPSGSAPVPETQELAKLDRLLTRERERLLRVRAY